MIIILAFEGISNTFKHVKMRLGSIVSFVTICAASFICTV